jgi:hypothetical protein
MGLDTLNSDLFVNGNLSAKTMTVPAGAVLDAGVGTGGAGANIQAIKLQHQYDITYSQDSTTSATVERRVCHVAKGGNGTIVDFRVGAVVAAAAAGNCVFDLLKNGTTVLSGTITIDSTNLAYTTKQPSGYTSTSYVAGDVFEFKVTSSAVTKPTGVFLQLILREDPQ